MNQKAKTFLTIALLLCASTLSAQQISLRVMSMNIKECAKYDNFKTSGYAECIRKYNPDVIALQEVDNLTLRNGLVDWLTKLASEVGMLPYYGKSFTYSGGAFGVALLSRYPYYQAQTVVSNPTGAREPRACASIYITLPGGATLRVVSAHLAVESEELRIQNLADINRAVFADDKTPTVMMGDMNATPDGEALTYARIRWQDIGKDTGFTIPTSGPTSRIDYVLGAPKKWSYSSYEIVAYPALSDHCFIVADIKFAE